MKIILYICQIILILIDADPEYEIYPRSNDYQTVYLNAVVRNPAIVVGDYTIYNDFVNDPDSI